MRELFESDVLPRQCREANWRPLRAPRTLSPHWRHSLPLLVPPLRLDSTSFTSAPPPHLGLALFTVPSTINTQQLIVIPIFHKELYTEIKKPIVMEFASIESSFAVKNDRF